MMAGGLAAPADAKETEPFNYDYGPPPEWNHYKELGEQAIRAILVDPESARFEWVHGYHKGGWKPLFERRRFGYVTCGYVNARNRMGGYSGSSAFVVVIDNDRVVYVDMAKSVTDFVSEGCEQSARIGMFPAPSSMQTGAVEVPPTGAAVIGSGLGLAITPTAQGAYVQSVAPGLDADRAGLTPGMVITTMNGLPLGTLGDAMLKVIEAYPSPVLLTILGQGKIELIKTASPAAGVRP